MRDVTLLAEQYTYPAVIDALTDYLKGDGYCQDPALGLNMDEITSCQENLDGFMGPALTHMVRVKSNLRKITQKNRTHHLDERDALV